MGLSGYDRVREVLERSELKGSGSDWQCPAHEDRKASLSFKEGNDGNALLKCHAGCSVEDIARALSMTVSDLFTDDGNTAPRVVATYPYTDEGGTVLFEVLRYSPRGFKQRRPDGQGGYEWKLNGVRRVPYRLPQVIAAVRAGKPIYIAEGEKDVHAIEQAGAVATCNPGGAEKWRDEFSSHLAGADVIVVADKDDAGERHAVMVRDSVESVAKSLRIVQAAEGKDAHDHLTAGLGLDALVEQASAPTKPKRQRYLDGEVFAFGAGDEIETVPDWGRGPEVLMAEGERSVIVGPQGIRKTTLALQICRHRIGLGGPELLGYPVLDDGRKVLYIAADRPAQIRRMARKMLDGDDRDVLRERLSVWRGGPGFDIARDPTRLVEWLDEIARENGDTLDDFGLVVLDSLKDFAMGLSADEVGAGINMAMNNVVDTGTQLLGLHHQKKRQGDKPPKTLDDVYGNFQITGGAGSVVLLWGEPGDPIVELSHLKQPEEPVGPFKVLIDHDTLGMEIAEGSDLLSKLRASRGLTVSDAARTLFDTASPTVAQVEKARRKLDGLVKKELAFRRENDTGTPTDPKHTYFAIEATGYQPEM